MEDDETSHTQGGAMSFLKRYMTQQQFLCGKDMTGEQLQLWDAKHDCDAARVGTQPVYTTVIHQLDVVP